MPDSSTLSTLLRKIACSTDLVRLDIAWDGDSFDYVVPDRDPIGADLSPRERQDVMPSPRQQAQILTASRLSDLLGLIVTIEMDVAEALRLEVNYDGKKFKWVLYRRNITASDWNPRRGLRNIEAEK